MSPGEISQALMEQANEYSTLCEKLSGILERKPTVWNELRPGYASDTACTRAFEATPDGIAEMSIRLRLKALDKVMSAEKTRLRIMEGESRNLY